MSKLERRLVRNLPERDPHFLHFAKDYTSQGGEDGILEEIFRLLYDNKFSGDEFYCVDIGAWDGVHLSNTYHLLHDLGWSGVLVEAEPDRCDQLRKLYGQQPNIHCLSALVDIDGPNSLNALLDSCNCPKEPHFISIDIDGADYHLWKSIGLTYRAHVVCIEFNPSIPNSIYFVQANNVKVQQGSSLLAMIELGKELGYEIVSTTTFNAIFVRNDLFQQYMPTKEIIQDINHLHIPFMATEMFQTYDGELKFVGTKKLLWHKLSINPQQLQILPKKDRKYPFAPDSFTHMNQLKSHIQGIGRFFVETNQTIVYHDNDKALMTMEELQINITKFIDLLSLTYIRENGYQMLQGMVFQVLWSQKKEEEGLLLYNEIQLQGLLLLAFQLHQYATVREKDELLQALQYDQLAYTIVEKVLHMQQPHESSSSSSAANALLFTGEMIAITIQLSIARYVYLQQQYIQSMQLLTMISNHLLLFEHHNKNNADSSSTVEEGEESIIKLMIGGKEIHIPSISSLFVMYEKLQRKCITHLQVVDPGLQIVFPTKTETKFGDEDDFGLAGSPYSFTDSIKVRKTSKQSHQKKKQFASDQHEREKKSNATLAWTGGIGTIIALTGLTFMYMYKKQ